MNEISLYVVVPCYNESEVLPITSKQILIELKNVIDKRKISDMSRILFVDDGSDDGSWDIITDLVRSDYHYLGIRQSRNRGHQSSLLAGMMEAKDVADIVITIDCDGQDDISAIEKMIDEYYNGAEVVYGVRNSRESDTFFKRFTAQSFYKLMKYVGAEVVYDHGDYRLVSSRVLQELAKYKEVNLFLRGMFPLIGFKSTCVYYNRKERIAGKSHYSIAKMKALALDGIFNLSIQPIRFITGLGIVVAVISFLFTLWSIVSVYIGDTVSGWASMTCIISFIGGVQLVCMGILGEYIGKIYLEVKDRPRFIIDKRIEHNSIIESDEGDLKNSK